MHEIFLTEDPRTVSADSIKDEIVLCYSNDKLTHIVTISNGNNYRLFNPKRSEYGPYYPKLENLIEDYSKEGSVWSFYVSVGNDKKRVIPRSGPNLLGQVDINKLILVKLDNKIVGTLTCDYAEWYLEEGISFKRFRSKSREELVQRLLSANANYRFYIN